MKTDEQRAIAWLLSEDTGTSSTSILAHMLGEHYEDVDAPHDPSDLGRCVRLLALFPAWVPRMGEMAKYGPAWAGLVEDWQKIVDLYHAESAQHSESRQPSVQTYRAMKLAIANGYRKDERYTCRFDKDGSLSWASRKPQPGDDQEEE